MNGRISWIKFLQNFNPSCIITPFFKYPPYEISGMRSAQTVDGWHSGDICYTQGPKGQALRRETLRQKDRGDFFSFFLEYRMISVFL